MSLNGLSHDIVSALGADRGLPAAASAVKSRRLAMLDTDDARKLPGLNILRAELPGIPSHGAEQEIQLPVLAQQPAEAQPLPERRVGVPRTAPPAPVQAPAAPVTKKAWTESLPTILVKVRVSGVAFTIPAKMLEENENGVLLMVEDERAVEFDFGSEIVLQLPDKDVAVLCAGLHFRFGDSRHAVSVFIKKPEEVSNG